MSLGVTNVELLNLRTSENPSPNYDLGAGLYRLPDPLVAHESKPDYTHIRSPNLLRLSLLVLQILVFTT